MAADEQPKIKLYWLNQSRSQRIIWLLEELHLDYEVEIFHRDPKTKLSPPELLKVHPLGKAPVLSITPPGGGEPIVLVESGVIIQYLCDHFTGGARLVPQRWKEGQEGKVGGETDGWLRYQHILHYSEGSLMPVLVMTLVMNNLKSSAIPFYIRPISSAIANQIIAGFIFPDAKRHLAFLEGLLNTSPGGSFLCGPDLSAVDILMSFPLIAAKDRFQDMGRWEGGSVKACFPKLFEYIERLETAPGYVASAKKIEELEGTPFRATL